MKIITRSFNYQVKVSANYNSYQVGEGFEVELDDHNVDDVNKFEALKTSLKLRVRKEIDQELFAVKLAKDKPKVQAQQQVKLKL